MGVTDGVLPYDATFGKNVATSKLPRAGWMPMYCWGDIDVTNVNLYEGNYSNLFIFGGDGLGVCTQVTAMKAEDAWNIKSDDGKPGLAKTRNFERDTNCQDTGSQVIAVAAIANYKLTGTDPNACSLLFNF
ncbi:MAG: hypothetical protein ACOYNL_00690 [Rickettsiales bacterium]